MAQRKSKITKKEAEQALEDLEALKQRQAEETEAARARVEELELLQQKDEQDELDRIESIRNQIEQIGTDNDVFCGIILTHEDLLNILSIALTTQENIKIKCNVYYTNE